MRQLQITSAITNREGKSTDLYLSEIGKVDLISAEEEAVLAQKIRQGDQAALDKLTRANLRFVVSVAKKYQHQGLPLNDLISEGNLGLMKAAKRFDETRGFKFISFAVWWIRQSIMEAITVNARMIRLPMNKVGEITKINKAKSTVEQILQREPTLEQVAEYLETSIEKIASALAVAPWTGSLDAPLGDGDEYSLHDRITTHENLADHALIAEDAITEVQRLLSHLNPREKTIIDLSFGLTGERLLHPADVAPIVGLTAERVRQIRNIAIDKLKNAAKPNAKRWTS
jgi:RNA polymerase primary sigma factor